MSSKEPRLIYANELQRKICAAKCGCEYEDCGNEGDCEFDFFIFHAPTIDPESLRPHGKWERARGDMHSSGYAVWCTNCGKYHFVHYQGTLGGLYGHDELFREPPNCPNCGAIMEVDNV